MSCNIPKCKYPEYSLLDFDLRHDPDLPKLVKVVRATNSCFPPLNVTHSRDKYVVYYTSPLNNMSAHGGYCVALMPVNTKLKNGVYTSPYEFDSDEELSEDKWLCDADDGNFCGLTSAGNALDFFESICHEYVPEDKVVYLRDKISKIKKSNK